MPDWIATPRPTEADDGRRIELARARSLAVSLRAPTAAGVGWRELAVPAAWCAPGASPPGLAEGRAVERGRAGAAVAGVRIRAREGAGGELVLELAGDTVSRARVG